MAIMVPDSVIPYELSTGVLRRRSVTNPYIFGGKAEWYWVITLDEDGSEFDKYRTKAQAVADAKKYNIKLRRPK